ncbi:MAG: Uxx-star family glutaredoxin-like (seleno)protein [Meiothermus sp.]|uniref:Uxx-star family glutaredoxin-like (seleno)protein n=1 Tax=Meiothermus sp. TaxID=1955249 RepID=UPI0028CE1CDB|nr:Uxx-star family glutaredoxin-like (seleno)protein [Meiothermus sp.]MDT7920967.1 Uxx-star family glutaredoxin-like (seleno)protein [Meiothermus sp.]
MLELFGTPGCAFTAGLREDLQWRGLEFIEYDVKSDAEALKRMLRLTHGQRTVPVLVQDNQVVQIGWQGRGCVVGKDS